jgi:putative ABC transport system permease protein
VAISPQPSQEGTVVIDGSWIPLPQDFTKVQGIEAATRVGDFNMRITPVGSGEIRGRFIAIDRVEFPSAAWFRPDFANESLGAMMNRLAPLPEGILVSQDFLEEHNLRAGDTLEAVVSIENLMSVWSEFTIFGTYNYFPTVYEDSVTFVGNLEYLNTLTGLTVAHNMWIKTTPSTDVKQLGNDITNQLHIFPGCTTRADWWRRSRHAWSGSASLARFRLASLPPH